MHLYYFEDLHGNFGDDLNRWMWDELLPGWQELGDDGHAMSVIGTIISGKMGKKHPDVGHWHVFSSGTGYNAPPVDFDDREKWNVVCVRGPLSAKVLGLSQDKAVTDGAALLRVMKEFSEVPESDREGVVFMPHHNTGKEGEWRAVCEKLGIGYLDPSDDCKETLHKIRNSKLVLAGAMHAAICADAMRVPWLPITNAPDANSFKWMDWTLSVDAIYKPFKVGASSFRESLRNSSLKLIGSYEFDELAESTALEHYRKGCAQKRTFGYWLKRVPVEVGYRFFRKLLSFKVVDRAMEKKDRKIFEQATERMKQAAGMQGYLSDEKILDAKVAELQRRLELFRKDLSVSSGHADVPSYQNSKYTSEKLPG